MTAGGGGLRGRISWGDVDTLPIAALGLALALVLNGTFDPITVGSPEGAVQVDLMEADQLTTNLSVIVTCALWVVVRLARRRSPRLGVAGAVVLGIVLLALSGLTTVLSVDGTDGGIPSLASVMRLAAVSAASAWLLMLWVCAIARRGTRWAFLAYGFALVISVLLDLTSSAFL